MSKTNDPEIGPKERHRSIPVIELASMYASGRYSNAKIARHFGVGIKTFGRWIKHPRVVAAVNRIHNEAIERASAKLTMLQTEAVEEFRSLIRNKDGATPPGVRLAAARSALEFGGRATKIAHDVNLGGSLSVGVGSLEELQAEARELARRLGEAVIVPTPGRDG